MGKIDIDSGDLDTSNSYTLELWFKSSDKNKRSILFAALQDDPDWNGLYIWANSNNSTQYPGAIQIAEKRSGNSVNSLLTDPVTNQALDLIDGKWHYLVIIRTPEDYLQLWIDNQKHGELQCSPISHGSDSIGWVANMRPGDYKNMCSLSEMAFYNYAWQELQIQHRYAYATRYRVSGYTLLLGAPIKATVRFYDHLTGMLMGELESDPADGSYVFYSKNNKYLDVVSYIPDEKTTRYRIHGPVIPAEDYDSIYD